MSFISDFDPFQSPSPLQAASRFDAYFDVYGLSLKQAAAPTQRVVTLIARSPASPCAQALAINLGRFQPASVDVAIILAQIAPAASLQFLCQSLAAACGQAPETMIRWAKNRALLEAHERLTLGATLCWTGDSMRRADNARTAIDRVDDGTPEMMLEAGASFTALWRASKVLPKGFFTRGCSFPDKGPSHDAEVFPGNLGTEPNIVRLDEYLRYRRH